MEKNEFTLQPVQSVKPIAPWLGGKAHLADNICPRIDTTDHCCYVDVFGGMGGIFFRRQFQPKVEVLNDISRDIHNLFLILREHYPQLLETMKYQITSRREFERLVRQEPNSLTDLQRAARFLYLQRTAFGGKCAGQSFGTTTTSPGRFDLTKLAPLLEDVHERLSGVVLECETWQRVIARYDRPHTLFYLDPPYHGCEDDYGKGLFGETDFTEMASVLSEIQGRFILSINDTPEIRRWFSDFTQEEVSTRYSAGLQNAAVGELLISNYDHVVQKGLL
ncbi:MAG: DNA adenine methylase [Alphaproteobacteria bacterium]